MTTATRLAQERQFHDRQARDRAVTFARDPYRLRFTDDEYLDHESWVRSAFAQLGDVRGKRVLDWGCGHGMAAVVLARHGAKVKACDLSPGYCAEVRRRAKANHVKVDVIAADCERLPFADHSFDSIWGHAILHHLDVAVAAREIRRVLRSDGVAVLCEPWDGNPIIRLVRHWRDHTSHERPLRSRDLHVLRDHFNCLSVIPFQLVDIFRSVFTRAIDRFVFAVAPSSRNLGRYVVLRLT